MTPVYDIAIIGGGINGCGCAADAALRGLSVILCEKDDLASQTSSSSSKLIHGGLRYLEQFDFSLVRKALNERQNLLELAPYLVHPLQFILPQSKKMRSSWVVRTGLFIYDHLSKRNSLPKSTTVTRKLNPNFFKSLLPAFKQAFSYYDCSTDDSRLTIANAIQAQEHGANILSHTEVIRAEVIDHIWHLTIKTRHQEPRIIKAKALINAAGPWVSNVNQMLSIPNYHTISLVKGSHIVLPALYEGQHAYVLQHSDKRIVFTIPYHGYTLVGTTDIPFTKSPEKPSISNAEIDYLLDLTALYFNKKRSKDSIKTSWSGLRPLLSDPGKSAQTLTRDYVYHLSTKPAPCITIYGGKITTYRLLAEKVVNQLQHIFPDLPHSKTITTPLPGAANFYSYVAQARQTYPWIEEAILNHYLQTYGTRTDLLLQNCQSMSDLGAHFADVLYQCEVDYLIKHEWVTSVDDLLWRRTKLGLHFDNIAREKLAKYLLEQIEKMKKERI